MICNMLEDLHFQWSLLWKCRSLKYLSTDGFGFLALQWNYQSPRTTDLKDSVVVRALSTKSIFSDN